MALDNRQKDRFRHFIRVTMVVLAVILLLCSVAIPIANNAVALGVEGDLKSLPLPEDTQVVESTSAAGHFVGNGNGMQYFGALLLTSDASLETLKAHYRTYDGVTVEVQSTGEIQPAGLILNGTLDVSFRTEVSGEGYYLLYAWGKAPAWLRDVLNADIRGH